MSCVLCKIVRDEELREKNSELHKKFTDLINEVEKCWIHLDAVPVVSDLIAFYKRVQFNNKHDFFEKYPDELTDKIIIDHITGKHRIGVISSLIYETDNLTKIMETLTNRLQLDNDDTTEVNGEAIKEFRALSKLRNDTLTKLQSIQPKGK